jgi:hypothetical protein
LKAAAPYAYRKRVGDRGIISSRARQSIAAERKHGETAPRIVSHPQRAGRRKLRRLAAKDLKVGTFGHDRHVRRERGQDGTLAMKGAVAVPGDEAHQQAMGCARDQPS